MIPKHMTVQAPPPLRTAELQVIAQAWDEQNGRERESGTMKYRKKIWKKGGGNMLEQLKRFDPEAGDLEEAIALAAFASIFQGQYQMRSLETPTWLRDKREALDREIQKRHRDYLEKELKEEVSRLDKLKTAEEKRVETKAKIARIKAALGQAEPAQPAAGVPPGSVPPVTT